MLQELRPGAKLDQTVDAAFPNGSQPTSERNEEDRQTAAIVSRNDCGKSRHCRDKTDRQS